MKNEDAANELNALQRLLDYRRQDKLVMYRSRVVHSEIGDTKDSTQRSKLLSDYEMLDQIPQDEKVVGFHNAMDRFGGASYPLVSDIQDDRIFSDIKDQLDARLGPPANKRAEKQRDRDARHLTQAIANKCEVFLTRDYATIIRPLREYLHSRYGIKVLLPSELALELERQ